MERQQREARRATNAQGGAAEGSLQEHTLQAFTRLHAIHAFWRGKLALVLGVNDAATAVALAVLGLGGTCLVVDADTESLHAANRAGATDFIVNTLTEALRILKNELRKGSPVSVGLKLAPAPVVSEMLQRGVEPDAIYATGPDCSLVRPFLERASVDLLQKVAPHDASRGYELVKDEALNGLERKRNDARIVEETIAAGERNPALRSDLPLAWMRAAPQLFPRDRERVYWRRAEA